MLIPIPIGQRHLVTVAGREPKIVHCESCRAEYVYITRVAAQGEGFNPLFLAEKIATEEATRQAKAKLADMLATMILPIPCPVCGWYQEYMIGPARESRYGGKMMFCKVFGVFCAVMILPFLLLAGPGGGHMIPDWVVILSAIPATIFGVLLVSFAQQKNRFNPNLLPESERITIGKTYALPKAEFDAAADIPKHD